MGLQFLGDFSGPEGIHIFSIINIGLMLRMHLYKTSIIFFTRPATEQVTRSWDPLVAGTFVCVISRFQILSSIFSRLVFVQFSSVRRETGETLISTEIIIRLTA